MKKELDTFMGYSRISGYTVAEFKPLFVSYVAGKGIVRKIFKMDKSGCQSRLKNLQNGGHAHDQTLLALETWPVDE